MARARTKKRKEEERDKEDKKENGKANTETITWHLSLSLSLSRPHCISLYIRWCLLKILRSRLLNSTLSVYCVAATFLARTHRSAYDDREGPTRSRPAPVERERQRRSRSAPAERKRFLQQNSKFWCHRKTYPSVQIFLKRIDRHNGSIPG